MSKKIIGKCHICGQDRELTWEHIPPKSSGNNVSVKYNTFDELLSEEVLSGASKAGNMKFHISQGGLKMRTICSDCNNITGASYVSSYSDLAVNLKYGLNKIDQIKSLNNILHFNSKIKPLNFLKEVLALFCSVLPYNTVQKYGFSDFVLNRELQSFPNEDFDIYMYVSTTKNGHYKFVPPTGVGNVINNTFLLAAEISAPPMGFLLSLTPETQLKLPSIKLMNKHRFNDEVEYSFDLPLLKPVEFPLMFETFSLLN